MTMGDDGAGEKDLEGEDEGAKVIHGWKDHGTRDERKATSAVTIWVMKKYMMMIMTMMM